MKCLIAGASGLVGSELLQLLLADPTVESVTTVVRRPLESSGIEQHKLQQVVADFAQIRTQGLPASGVAFCCLGTTIAKAGSQEAFYRVDHDYILNFAHACFAAGVQVFVVVSAMGASGESSVFYNRVKGQTEADLAKIDFKSLVIIRPSLLLGERTEKRPAEKLAQVVSKFFAPMMVGPLAKVRPVPAKLVAQKMKLAAEDRTLLKFQVIENDQL